MQRIRFFIKEILRYPAALVGLLITLSMISLAIYAVIAIPYQEAIRLWRGGEEVWFQNPRNGLPKWTNWFVEDQLPESVLLEEGTTVQTNVTSSGNTETITTYTFDFTADEFPQELALYFTADYEEKQPFTSLTWLTPDGREIALVDFGLSRKETFRLSQDPKLQKRLGRSLGDREIKPIIGLFIDPASITEEEGYEPQVLKGEYSLVVNTLFFEDTSESDSTFVMHGLVFGWAGTDHQRRDLMLPLVWGAPIALTFGLLASLGISFSTIIISALGVWYGGVVDEIIQRITEVNLSLPFLSILIMIGTFYSKSIWTILGATILLSIFGGGIKTYRAIFLQIKESTYIEAAQTYGAGSLRIIFLYMIPRIVPLIIPGLILAVPTFVFLEASLAVLGLGDPVLPTWGKIINDAWRNAALYNGYYYWIIEPAVLLMFTGLGFAMLGYSLDRIFNPRLREL